MKRIMLQIWFQPYRPTLALVFILLAMLPLSLTLAQSGPAPTHADVPYVPDGHALQTLDIYLPEAVDGPYPTLLMIHGGSFRERSKAYYGPMAAHFVDSGYAVVSMDYRLLPDYAFPAQVEDAFCALAWMHTHAETYDFDPENIVAAGDSAGGYLAAMLGTVDDPGMFLVNCPHDLPETDRLRGVVVFYGGFSVTDAPHPELAPVSHVDASDPPFLLFHGAQDESSPVAESENFAALLEETGVPVELVIFRGRVGHGYLDRLSSAASRQSLEAMDRFLTALFGGARELADVPYIPDESPSHMLDIHLPPADIAGPYPVLFMIHGSGGSKRDFLPQVEYLLEQGYATVAIDYQEPQNQNHGPMRDAFCALAWVYDNIENYDFDAERVVVFGHSLGGWAAAMLGVVENAGPFMANCPNPTPDIEGHWPQGVVIYAGAIRGDEAPDQIAPYGWIDGTEPPFLLLHGDSDLRISPDVSITFGAALQAAGVEAEVFIIPDAGHGVRLYTGVSPELDAVMDAFLAAVFE